MVREIEISRLVSHTCVKIKLIRVVDLVLSARQRWTVEERLGMKWEKGGNK